MSIKLTITHIIDKKDAGYGEPCVFPPEKRTIKIGRSARINDVTLKDELNQVSSSHAQITHENDVYFLIDSKSRNKSFLNGIELKPEVRQQLPTIGEIKIANFFIKYEIINDIKNVTEILPPPPVTDNFEREELAPALSEITPSDLIVKPELNIHQLAENLRIEYKKHSDDPLFRRQILSDLIKANLSGLNKSEIQDKIELLRQEFPDQNYECEHLKIKVESLECALNRLTGDESFLKNSYNLLLHLARKWVDAESLFQSAADTKKFCDNIRETVESLIKSFLELDQGRKKVLQDIIGVWADDYASPLTNQPFEKVIQLLLDWRDTSGWDARQESKLEKSLQLIIIHEYALMKAYQTAIYKGSLELLKKINPENLRRKIEQKEFKIGQFRIPYKIFPPYVDYLVSKEYHRQINEISEKTSKYFDAFFRPYFAREYQDILKGSLDLNLNETKIFIKNNFEDLIKKNLTV